MILYFLLVLAVIIVRTCGTGALSASYYTTVKTREHETIFLHCYAGNLGSSSVRWWHEGELVTDAGEIFIQDSYRIHSNNTLEVIDVTEILSGAYVCQVKRPPPMAPMKHNYIIQVLHPPTIQMIPSVAQVEVELHQEITIYCNATGFPQPFISWTFMGEEIAEMRNHNSLSIIALKGNSGEYSCLASNGVGNSDMKSILISAVYPPSVRADKIWIHTSPGLRTVVECIVDGRPTPKVVWLKNNKPVPRDSRITFFKKSNKYGIVITSSRISDVGHYTCIASNKLGKNQLPIEVSAQANVAQFKPQQKRFEDKMTLIWEVESYSPIIQYHLLFRQQRPNEKPANWTKLNIPADGSSGGPIHTQSYTLSGLHIASNYEACVLSKNLFGWSKPSSIFKFATTGLVDNIDSFTTEEVTESNTITHFLTGYNNEADYENDVSEQSMISRAKSTSFSSVFVLLSIFTILRL